MTIAAQPRTLARTSDPEQTLNAVAPHIEHLTVNVMDGGPLWEREIALLLRDNTMVRNMAERIQVTEIWAGTGADFICGEVLEMLAADTATYDSVYSIFGAAWFTDPSRLFPLVAERLRPGGVLAFSHPPAIPGAYGPQGMYKGGFAGKAMFTYRYSYTPRRWTGFLERAGFRDVDARVLDAPEAGHIGTLLVTARR
ncbi:methyltransferase domain-containing protein [Streptomyces anulatus]